MSPSHPYHHSQTTSTPGPANALEPKSPRALEPWNLGSLDPLGSLEPWNLNFAGEELAGEELVGEELAQEEFVGEELTGQGLAGKELAGQEASLRASLEPLEPWSLGTLAP